MSKTIKLHTPAGRVRVLKRTSHTRDTQSSSGAADDVFPSLNETDGIRESGNPHSSEWRPADYEQRFKDEYKAGFDEGRRFTEKLLRDDLAAKSAEIQKTMEVLTANILKEYERLHVSAEHSLVKLALAIAERVVKREVAVDSEMVLRQIHEAAKRVIGVERIKIRVNPKDEEYIREHRTRILTSTDAVRDLVIEGDEAIERGGCILESDSGNVDALIGTQLERIESALLEEQSEK